MKQIISAGNIGYGIVSFVEHPLNLEEFLAITAENVIAVDLAGECTVLFGAEKSLNSLCSHTPNDHVFEGLTQIAVVKDWIHDDKLVKIGTPTHLVLTDTDNHCLYYLDLNNKNKVETIGECGHTSAQVPHSDEMGSISLIRPTGLTVVQSENSVTLFVVTNLYTAMIYITTESTLFVMMGFETRPSYVTLAADKLMLTGLEWIAGKYYCWLTGPYDSINNERQKIHFFCPDSVVQSGIHIPYLGGFLTIPYGKINIYDWPFSASNLTTTGMLQLRPILREDHLYSLTSLAVSSKSPTEIFGYSKGDHEFYVIDRKPCIRKHNKFTILHDTYGCKGNIVSSNFQQSLETCAYLCAKRNNKGFSYSSAGICSLFSKVEAGYGSHHEVCYINNVDC